MSYQDFIKSPEWRVQRQRIIERDSVCQNCGANKQLQVHHLVYTKDLTKVPDDKLVTLCKTCHSKLESLKKDCFEYINRIYEYEFFESFLVFLQQTSPLNLFYLYYPNEIKDTFINKKTIKYNAKRLDNILP